MADSKILKASSVITMEDSQPRAEAVAVTDGRIVAVGTLSDCQTAVPGAEVVDLGSTVLMPGFVEPHSHPFISGQGTTAPAISVAPWDVPTYEGVIETMKAAAAAGGPDDAFFFNGFDELLHRHVAPDGALMDSIFGDRPALLTNNSGHAAYFNAACARLAGVSRDTPDPVGGTFERDENGELTGVALEVAPLLMLATPIGHKIGGNPLVQGMLQYVSMSRVGITSTAELTYATRYKGPYEFMASIPGCPMRISLYHMSIEPDAAENLDTNVPTDLMQKVGIKLWADGSPWLGNIAISYDYLDTETTRIAAIVPRNSDPMAHMNYTREEIDELIDKFAPLGYQMAIHVNGDVAIDIVLDAYEAGLSRHGLLGSDHRWRVEHVACATPPQLARMAELGVMPSMFPATFYWWGDLLDGEMFPHEIGAQWQRIGTALRNGLTFSFHNDSAVTPPTPLRNVETAVTRRTSSGAERGLSEAVPLHEALKAITINGAVQLFREKDIGSIAVGKLADFVELSADPYAVEPVGLSDAVQVEGTWVSGARVDLDAYLAAGTPIAQQLLSGNV